jgi:hypothetical protein
MFYEIKKVQKNGLLCLFDVRSGLDNSNKKPIFVLVKFIVHAADLTF